MPTAPRAGAGAGAPTASSSAAPADAAGPAAATAVAQAAATAATLAASALASATGAANRAAAGLATTAPAEGMVAVVVAHPRSSPGDNDDEPGNEEVPVEDGEGSDEAAWMPAGSRSPSASAPVVQVALRGPQLPVSVPRNPTVVSPSGGSTASTAVAAAAPLPGAPPSIGATPPSAFDRAALAAEVPPPPRPTPTASAGIHSLGDGDSGVTSVLSVPPLPSSSLGTMPPPGQPAATSSPPSTAAAVAAVAAVALQRGRQPWDSARPRNDALLMDPMLPCRIALHWMEGCAGCFVGGAQLIVLSAWDSQRLVPRVLFATLPLSLAASKVVLCSHTAFRYHMARGGSGEVEEAKVVWKRSVRLFPALSLLLSMCYLVTMALIAVEVSSDHSSAQGYFMGFAVGMFTCSIILFLESFTAPKRVFTGTTTAVPARRPTTLLPPPPGRICIGRYEKVMKGAVCDTDSSFGTCSICLDTFQPKHEVARLPCGHIFHRDCVKEWMCVRVECPFRCPAVSGGGKLDPAPLGVPTVTLEGPQGSMRVERLRGDPRVSRLDMERYVTEHQERRQWWVTSSSFLSVAEV